MTDHIRLARTLAYAVFAITFLALFFPSPTIYIMQFIAILLSLVSLMIVLRQSRRK